MRARMAQTDSCVTIRHGIVQLERTGIPLDQVEQSQNTGHGKQVKEFHRDQDGVEVVGTFRHFMEV